MKHDIWKIIFIWCTTSLYVTAGITNLTNMTMQAITDNSCFNKTFTMLGSEIINDVNIEINLNHTWRADLDITLTSPQGTSVDITSDNGGSRNNLLVIFDDAAGTSITADNANHTSVVTRQSETPLSALNTEDALGIWTLQICDDAGADAGTFIYAILTIDATPVSLADQLIIEYKQDECYWLGSSQADILENINAKNAISMNGADTYQPTSTANYAGLCRAGNFNGDNYADVDVAFTLGTEWTMSEWIEFPLANTGQVYHVLGSYAGIGDLPLFDLRGFPNIKWGIYDNTQGYKTKNFNNGLSGWHQLTFTNIAGETKLYLDGTYHSTVALGTSGDVRVLNTSKDGFDTQTLSSNTDELKFWNKILTDEEIGKLYNNEKAGTDYDGNPRVCSTCEANATAGIWGLIGIPADLRTSANKDVSHVFDEFPAGSYNVSANADGWIVMKRNYSTTDNSSSYSIVPYNGTPLEFGQGYWLLSKQNVTWSENTLQKVDYNSTHGACTATSCVEIDMTAITKNFAAPDNDANDHSGRNRNNMLGFVGRMPVNWADCRILINGTSYTPSAADAAGYIDKQVWQYNPGVGGANANGYTTCDDTSPGGCKLEPYKGFWIVLHGKTKNTTVKLLIPKES
jgi:subtilisin-like proprotein convertase family protein